MEFSGGPTFLPPITSYPSSMNNVTLSWRDIAATAKGMKKGMLSPLLCSYGPHRTLRWSLRLLAHRSYRHANVFPVDPDVSIFLCCEASDKSDVEAKFRFFVRNRTNESLYSPEMKEYCIFKYGTEQASYGYRIRFFDALSFQKDIFDIFCDIEVHPDERNIIDQGAGEPSEVLDGTLLDTMVSVFQTKEYTDFMITNDGVSFPVHKAILSARSPVFDAMFKHDTKEQRDNCVDIKDMTPEALQEMLRFIYTNEVMDIEGVARDLLAPANKYALDGLKTMCEKTLGGNLVVENAAETLILADLHKAIELKTRAIDFISRRVIDVMDTPGFNLMMTSHPHLMAEIMRALATIGGLTSVKPPV